MSGMDCDIELEQIIYTALSLEDDYPELCLPPRNQDKTLNSTTFNDHFPAVGIQVPVQDTFQQTILELYSALGIQQEAKINRTMDLNVPEQQSMVTSSTEIKDKPCRISENANDLKRPFCEEEQKHCKKPKVETDADILPTTSNEYGSRKRTIYNKEQILFLKNQFDLNPYPDFVCRCRMSKQIGVPEPRIQVWFQNRRARQVARPRKSRDIHIRQSLPLDGTLDFIHEGPQYINPWMEDESSPKWLLYPD